MLDGRGYMAGWPAGLDELSGNVIFTYIKIPRGRLKMTTERRASRV